MKTIEEISKEWLDDKQIYVKKSTFSAYQILVYNHILPNFGKQQIINENDVQNFVLKKLNDGLGQKTIKDIIIVIKMILKYGVKNNYLEPTSLEIKFPTCDTPHEIEVLKIRDHRKLLTYIKENFTFKNLGIYICLSTGMRIGEICALTWENIDIENGVIKVRKTLQRIYYIRNEKRFTEIIIDKPKTKNSLRDIPISKDLLKMLKPLKKIVRDDYFVLTNEATPTEPRAYRNYYNHLLQQLNIERMRFHGLRHSFATRCIESKCDYKTVSVLLGHASISTTLNLYVHPNIEQKRKCIDQMHRALKI